MARIRSLKPEFFTSEVIAQLPFGGRLLFQAMWGEADDGGLMKASVKAIRVAAFPYDTNVTDEDVSSWIDKMVALGLVEVVEGVPVKNDGKGGAFQSSDKIVTLWGVVGFHEHQTPRKPTYRFKAVRDVVGSTSPVPQQYGTSAAPVQDSSMSDRDRDRERERENKNGATADAVVASDEQTTIVVIAEKPSEKTLLNKKIQELASVYTQLVPMSKHVAVQAVVRKALSSGFTEEQVAAGLVGLAGENRSVTVDSLRIQMQGGFKQVSKVDQRNQEVIGLLQRAAAREQGNNNHLEVTAG